MSDSPVLWISEREVAELVDLEDAIEALESGLRLEAAGDARNVAKALGTWGDGSSMHSLGSMFPEAGFVGFKTWANTKQGASTIFALFDSHNGQLRAVMESAVLGQLRTSAISGVATRWMARPDATVMALIGTGMQALPQIAAVAAVRPVTRVNVFSPNAERRRAFVELARSTFAFAIEESAGADAATAGADIVTLLTRAREPFLHAALLAPGTHLNAVGAILPQNAEFFDDVFERAGVVVVDHLPNVQRTSREFIEYYENGRGSWSEVKALSEVIAAGTGRAPGTDLSLFKAVGMGISDLSVGRLVYERALASGAGHPIAIGKRPQPRFRSAVAGSPR